MSQVNTVKILQIASKNKYCIGAFNIVDYLTLEAVIRAAEEKNSPVIIQTSQGTVKRYSARTLVTWFRGLVEASPIPAAIHMDHGTDTQLIVECIQAGFSSVMIDASKYPFDENVARTKEIVNQAHALGVSVEGEIGVMAGTEDELVIRQDQAIYTTPEEALEFQARSGVDFLAAAIGTAHGFYKVTPRLNIDTLRAIRAQADFPLVIHGGTGLSVEVVKELVASGGAKMNVSTQVKKTYIDSLFDYITEHRYEYDPLRVLKHAQKELIAMIGEYLDILGSTGRAGDAHE
jgi:ketose-bisphosphate aldolase